MESIISNGSSILAEAWTWISGNAIVGGIIGLAVLLIAVGGFLGLFLRR